jgi:hypothetical protein
MRKHGQLPSARMNPRLVLILLGLLALPGQDVAAAGTAGGSAPYLREGIGARALGMGNAQAADSTGAAALYWHPAALAISRGADISSQAAYLGE